ncbi:hypothetical protein H5185_08910 [Shewanella sp. SG44-6]|uniref:hypothetical protein n=1 Tax=Shewanella sp. SG44-6 TaxID=2760959 RepID=UPI001604538F|nr:hypothetical protein [Shewanella sp. SG44-6]MBB1389542.1 hypothetical protein [Shewanella sp. SG44-6]
MAFETINLGNQPTGTGGDTARSAFEKVNKNFITAEVLASSMSQAQFEAIRAENNEEYAASGFVHLGNHESGKNVNEVKSGLYTSLTTQNTLVLGKDGGLGGSKSDYAVINIAGVINHLTTEFKVKLPQAPDGKTTYNKATGANIVYATTTAAFNAAAVDVNLEVVTDRVDMWGFESWLEEVSATNPYVYPNGLIQSLAATMDGITTTASNRPVTYYAWFDGDTDSKGLGVDFFAATDAEKRVMLSNHKNKFIYLDDGRLVQWRGRGRSFAGAGNGDWFTKYNNLPDDGNIRFSSSVYLQAQGSNNQLIGNSLGLFTAFGTNKIYRATNFKDGNVNPTAKANNVIGAFSAGLSSGNTLGINSNCYFLVCGTVNRLNQGAYHPSFNPSGTGSWADSSSGVNINEGQKWHDVWHKASMKPTSKADAFNEVLQASTDFTKSGVFKYKSGLMSGAIGSSVNGRPDGCFYDAIYADGQGGVCRDMRYSANHTTLEKFAEADLKVKNGTYRGFEKRVFSRVGNYTTSSGGVQSAYAISSEESGYMSIGDKIHLEKPDGTYITRHIIAIGGGIINVDGSQDRKTLGYYVVETQLPSSVGGSFLQTAVIGNPTNILATPALANGWEGSWIPQLAQPSVVLTAYLTRKLIGTGSISYQYTLDNGSSWSLSSAFIDGVTNSVNVGGASTSQDNIYMYPYQAFAKQTEPTSKAVIHGGEFGLGNSRTSSNSGITYCNTLAESALGIILTGSGTNSGGESLTTLSNLISPDGTLSSAGVNHVSMKLPAPLNGSKGIKALDYNVNINQQAFKQYAATEMKWNGTSWGDDSQIHIVDGENTLTDLNGNTVKVVTHKLKEPIGWIKNTI